MGRQIATSSMWKTHSSDYHNPRPKEFDRLRSLTKPSMFPEGYRYLCVLVAFLTHLAAHPCFPIIGRYNAWRSEWFGRRAINAASTLPPLGRPGFLRQSVLLIST
jgi:hypothetical protein